MGLAGRGCRIEIALTLLASDSDLAIETVETSEAPEPVGHEPQAVRAGSFLFFSTQLPIDSRDGSPPRRGPPELPLLGAAGEAAGAAHARERGRGLRGGGSSLERLCRRQAFHDDFAHFAPAMEEWSAHFPVDPPASTTVEVGGPLLVPGAHVLLDLIGYVPGEPLLRTESST